MIRQLGATYDTHTVFEDFIFMAADAISNAVDPANFRRREDDYLARIGRYRTKSEREMFPKMFADLVLELERQSQYGAICDVLGDVYNELELYNKYRGQFFTPQNVSDMMAEILFPATLQVDDYITMYEPCCGAGGMIYAFANTCKNHGIDYQRKVLVTASDIDLKCVAMTYIQCSLYGIPAVVLHQNTLTQETWSVWRTPLYILGGWEWKKSRRNARVLVEHTADGPAFKFNFKDDPQPSNVAAERTTGGWQFTFDFV